VNEKIGHHRFLERCVERLYQAMRQAADEADGVGQKERLLVGQVDSTGRGVECREELVFHEHIRAGEAAQERGFSSVCVTDDGGIRDRRTLAVFSLRCPGAAHLLKLAAKAVDLSTQTPLVLLQLAFAFTTAANAAPLSHQVAPGAGQTRE
jgi:hypothetical protein